MTRKEPISVPLSEISDTTATTTSISYSSIKDSLHKSYVAVVKYSKKDGFGLVIIFLIILATIPIILTICLLLSFVFVGLLGLFITEGIVCTIISFLTLTLLVISLSVYMVFYISRIAIIDGMGGEENILKKIKQIRTLFGPPYDNKN